MDETAFLCDDALTDEDIRTVLEWVRTAGKLALATQRGMAYRLKPDATPVTETEMRIERFFDERIHSRFPGHGMLGEESGLLGAGRYAWAIDPIDGTRPYLWGLPTWGVSVGILCDDHPLAGFCYLPAVDELYWGWRGGAFCNGRELPPVTGRPFSDPMTFLCIPSNAHKNYKICYDRMHALGSTSMHLSLLARGVAAGVLTRPVYLWDLAGFLAIFPWLGIEVGYLSGRPVEITALLDGRKTPEPVLAAPRDWMDTLRACIEPLEGAEFD